MSIVEPPFHPFDDRVAMTIIAQWLNKWFLFDDGGRPRVIKKYRKKVTDENGDISYQVIEEICQLQNDDASMTADARAFLWQSWGEHKSWKDINL